MRAVRLISEHLHARRVRKPYDFPNVRADAVIGRVVDEHRLRGRVLLNGGLHIRDRHAERNAKPVVHLRVDVNRNRTGQHQCVDNAAVYVARQDNFVAAFDNGQNHRLYAGSRAAHHEEGVRRAERIGGQLFGLADNAGRVAQVVERLHRVDIHCHALLTEEFRQLRRTASALVAGYVERHNAHVFEVFERLHDWRTGLIHKNAFFRQRMICCAFARSAHEIQSAQQIDKNREHVSRFLYKE